MKSIPYGRQHITELDLAAVEEVLVSNFLTQGPKIGEFEERFSDYTGSKYAVAVANGTAALHLCSIALNVQKGQKVITTPITFAASANCVRYCRGEVVFADIDPETFLLDINSVRKLLETAPKGTYSGMIPVDFAGRAINMEAFRVLADEYNLWIIEDSCHAPGAFFRKSNGENSKCGSGEFADLAIFSFHPVKHIASGEGGMVTTNNETLYNRLLSLRTHGIVTNNNLFVNSPEFASGQNGATEYPEWYMEMQDLGFNYRITDIQAALGMSQLTRAEDGIKRRQEIARRYFNALDGRDFIIRQIGVVEGHAYHLYVIEVENRLGLYKHLRTNNIFSQIHYIPCHLMPYYRTFGWKEGDLPVSEEYYKNCLSLPMYPTLLKSELEYILEKINIFYKCPIQ